MIKTAICTRVGIELPVFAFSHCRDVVAAVSKAGGFGVLGAAYFTPEQLREELDWIDARLGGLPYGVDIILPQQEPGGAHEEPDQLAERLRREIPAEYFDFAERLLQQHGVPPWPDPQDPARLLGWTAATTLPLLEESLRHDGVRVIASALGTPPPDLVERIRASGRLVAGLCGTARHAIKHRDAGADLVVAVGGEGGGHVGEIGSIVLWPEVVDAVAPLPVLAAGGIGNGRQVAAALATGAQGVWTGSLWLTVEEAAGQPAQRESYLRARTQDTVRSRSWSGKPSRVLRNKWTDAWQSDDAPQPLGLPEQGLVAADAMRRTERYAGVADTQSVACNPAGQIIGQLNTVESCRQVMHRLTEEYLAAVEPLLP